MTEHEQVAQLFESLISDFGGTSGVILDFGCGAGRLVEAFERNGMTAYGCDVRSYLANDLSLPADRFRLLSRDPYRLPYPDNFFDAVVSTSVLEHVSNTEEVFRELHRVLKPGGFSLHLFPGRWYLPSDPHTFVPLVNYFWPSVPRWWLKLWAVLGVRNEYQKGKSATEVTDLNEEFCKHNLTYLPTRAYEKMSMNVFGNFAWPMSKYFEQSGGGTAKIWRALPAKTAIEKLSREFRMRLLAQRKGMSLEASCMSIAK